MAAEFVVRNWNAWAPGISCREDWQNWDDHQPFAQQEKAAISVAVPKLLQRRLSPLARAVFNAAEGCIDSDKVLPIVFSSAHGEVNKSLEMLQSMQRGEDVSPTAFSLSVHNAISGLFSMAYGYHQEITVIAPGQDGIAPAFIEALGLLQEGHADEVLIVLYDEPLSDFYPSLPFALNAPAICALALKISLAGSGLPLQFCRSSAHRNDGEHALQIFSFLKFLVADDKALVLGNHRHSWEWHKR
ncbi:beta-ketoacyl synthase chain length factor [Methylobacter sp.]|uniref:beta-ketoacyl synthase chain length factor n=1 Tax=Methylobacter sp. TaxID=2051955 RepID=UPI002FDC89C3